MDMDGVSAGSAQLHFQPGLVQNLFLPHTELKCKLATVPGKTVCECWTRCPRQMGNTPKEPTIRLLTTAGTAARHVSTSGLSPKPRDVHGVIHAEAVASLHLSPNDLFGRGISVQTPRTGSSRGRGHEG